MHILRGRNPETKKYAVIVNYGKLSRRWKREGPPKFPISMAIKGLQGD